MFRITTGLMLMGSLCGVASAADDIVLRSSVEPAEAWVGQRVVLQVDVLGADGWAQIKRFGDVDLPGAYLIRTDSQGTRLQESIDGTSYTGQRYEVSVYPQKPGTIAVPPLPVEVTIKTWGADASQTVRKKQTPAAMINAKLPPGAEGVRGLISSSRLTAAQQWNPAVEAPQVGDALQRTVTLQADDVSGMAFVPLQHTELPGVGIYPAEPEVEDTSDRGILTGRRTETVTYVFEHAGETEIPDIVKTWWDTSKRELETAVLPGRRYVVSPGPQSDTGTRDSAAIEPSDYRTLALSLIIALITGFLLLRFRPSMGRRWRAWRRRWNESEAKYFRLALKSIRSGEPNAALRDSMKWLDRIDHREQPAQLDAFLVRYAGPGAQMAFDQLVRGVSTGERYQNSNQLIATLKSGRRRWRQNVEKDTAHLVLPALNKRLSAGPNALGNTW